MFGEDKVGKASAQLSAVVFFFLKERKTKGLSPFFSWQIVLWRMLGKAEEKGYLDRQEVQLSQYDERVSVRVYHTVNYCPFSIGF